MNTTKQTWCVAGIALLAAGPLSAATITFTGGDGADLTNPANWSGLPVPPATNTSPIATANTQEHDLVFNGSATTSTWTGSSTSWYVRTITFSAPNGFTMANNPNGTFFLTQDLPTAQHQTLPLIRTTEAQVYGMSGHSPTEPALYELAAGSTLNINSAMAHGADMKIERSGTGAGATLNLNYGGAARLVRLNIGERVLVTNNGPGGNGTELGLLSGAGELNNIGGRLRLRGQDFTANGFTGTIRSSVDANASYVVFETTSAGTSTATFTGGRFLADTGAFKGVINVTLQGSELANTGANARSRFSFTDNPNQNSGSGTARLLTASGVSFKPGQDGVAKIMEVYGDVALSEYNSADSTLYIDITGAGAVAGADYDQLFIRRATTNGGDVTSVSDLTNRLADLDLVVNVSELLTEGDLLGDTLTILLSDKTGLSFVGSSFASVTFVPGWDGDVNYNSNGTVTLSNLTFVPEPGPATLALVGLGGAMVFGRRAV